LSLGGEAEAISFLKGGLLCPDTKKSPPEGGEKRREEFRAASWSGAGLVFGVFDLKPIVAYAKANPLGGK